MDKRSREQRIQAKQRLERIIFWILIFSLVIIISVILGLMIGGGMI